MNFQDLEIFQKIEKNLENKYFTKKKHWFFPLVSNTFFLKIDIFRHFCRKNVLETNGDLGLKLKKLRFLQKVEKPQYTIFIFFDIFLRKKSHFFQFPYIFWIRIPKMWHFGHLLKKVEIVRITMGCFFGKF